MLQIITYLLCFYLVVKGFEFLQIALASNRENRTGIIFFAVVVLIACCTAAGYFAYLQDQQAHFMSRSSSDLPRY